MKKTKRVIKSLLLSASTLIFLFIPISCLPTYASTPEKIELVFVTDTSFSMTTNDKKKIATEVLNMFLDLNNHSQTNVGFVFYNDQIVHSQSLIPLAEIKDKSLLKRQFDSIKRNGYTDLGLGLKEAQELFQSNSKEQTKRAMIVLTDGEIDLPIDSERTKKDSENDIAKVIQTAKQEKYPIFTIGLGGSEVIDERQLEQIASETGGSTFLTKNAEALPAIFQSIFAKMSHFTLYPIASVTTNGKIQEVKIDIPYGVSEGSIILLSEEPIDDTKLYGKATVSELFQSRHYTILNIKQISEASLLLNFKGALEDLVTVSFLSKQGLDASIELQKERVEKGEQVIIRSNLFGVDHPLELPSNLEGELIVNQDESSPEIRLPMKNMGSYFELQHSFSTPGLYKANALIKGENFQIETKTVSFEITNSHPFLLQSAPIRIKKGKEHTTINLNEYFSDPNKDKLSYKIQTIDGDTDIKATIDENLLTLSSDKIGAAKIDLLVSDDGNESILSTLEIKVDHAWNPAFLYLGLFTCGICSGLIFFNLNRKKSFIGRMEGVFHSAERKNIHSKKYWSLASFKNQKKIAFTELLSCLDFQEEFLDAEHIYFLAGKDGVLYLKHHSSCIILIGGFIVPRNKKIAIRNNDKLTITSSNGMMEAELLYWATEKFKTIDSYFHTG